MDARIYQTLSMPVYKQIQNNCVVRFKKKSELCKYKKTKKR